MPRSNSFKSDSPQAKTALKWIKDCEKGHDNEWDICRKATSSKLPPRVIDVLTQDEPFLLETDGQTGEYATLSCCWGPSDNPAMATYGPRSKGTQGQPDPEPNIESHKKAIPLSSMPLTFQDAVTFCRQLQVKYLWIESFCIIQGDSQEWQAINPQMADIFANSKFTISADKAADLDTGLLNRANSSSNSDPTEQSDDPLTHAPPSESPLPHRAWSLSSAIFSNRIIHFTSSSTSTSLLWECNTLRRDSSGRVHLIHDEGESFRPLRRRTFARRVSFDGMYRSWYTVTRHFSRRRAVGGHGDGQDALGRVARRFAEILRDGFETEDKYLAGIWEGDLPRGLAWSVEGTGGGGGGGRKRKEKGGRHPGYTSRAPSWSWAAIDGPIRIEPLEDFRPSGTFSARTTYRDGVEDSEFGRVVAGRLRVHGTVVHDVSCVSGTGPGDQKEMKRGEDPIAKHRCWVTAPDSKTRISFVRDVAMDGGPSRDETERLSCLFLGSGRREAAASGDSESVYNVILLLKRVPAQTSMLTFERVGISSLDISAKDASEFLAMAKWDNVDIV